jgi:esterase/lipase superfamily enzyme
VKLSLENNSFIHPLIGFSWPSNTYWSDARSIAAENGPKLANLIFSIKKECPSIDIRLVAHSLGASCSWSPREFASESDLEQ